PAAPPSAGPDRPAGRRRPSEPNGAWIQVPRPERHGPRGWEPVISLSSRPSTFAPPPRRPARRPPRMGYQPGLDGLRALSVVAVMLYHAGVAWLPGGFLGVEVFFVVSGYLITALLCEEW